ncbi:uncharacterized protein LOC112150991 [Oryzias melastigma]|uniref:uncharacterized protein LOC112150991 n=1 Tax=Oryzias melastigma TaxID=30732 RepID=UPI000CF801ED|nr:uncharacterized protein LOC112150991 [Oryzias melastigma]
MFSSSWSGSVVEECSLRQNPTTHLDSMEGHPQSQLHTIDQSFWSLLNSVTPAAPEDILDIVGVSSQTSKAFQEMVAEPAGKSRKRGREDSSNVQDQPHSKRVRLGATKNPQPVVNSQIPRPSSEPDTLGTWLCLQSIRGGLNYRRRYNPDRSVPPVSTDTNNAKVIKKQKQRTKDSEMAPEITKESPALGQVHPQPLTDPIQESFTQTVSEDMNVKDLLDSVTPAAFEDITDILGITTQNSVNPNAGASVEYQTSGTFLEEVPEVPVQSWQDDQQALPQLIRESISPNVFENVTLEDVLNEFW